MKLNNNLFNIDLVGAKTGKKLTNYEKRLQYIVNLFVSRALQFFAFSITTLIVAIFIKGLVLVLLK